MSVKILQLCIRFPPAPGGAEVHALSISKELIARGHEVKVFTSDLYMEVPFKRMKNPDKMVSGIPVKRFKAYSLKKEMHYVFMPSMFNAVLKEKPDIIHSHSYGYFNTNVAAISRKTKHVPFVLTPHFHPPWSMWGGDRRKSLRRFYDRMFGSRVLNTADRIIGVSEHEMELMSEVGFDKNKIKVIPNGIDFEKFDPIPSGSSFKEHYSISGKMVLYAGRLASNKGLTHLINAIPDVLKEFKETTFVLIGEDEGLKKNLKEQAESLGIEDSILFTGHIEDDELFRSSYSASDVFVLPSEYEAFGIVLLEAMACKKPCVATRVGGVPEVIEHEKTGILVDYGDPKALSDSICKLLGDEKTSMEMGDNGRKRVKEKFTWSKVVDELEKVYEDILN
jgi:glycosyltransferase involved in cell wall biosynthesis